MSITQYLRILWARRWVVLALFVLVAGGGIVHTLMQPKRYVAEVSMLVEMRQDPILGVVAPGLAQPAFMATQIEMIKSDRVAGHVAKILGVDKSESAIQAWRRDTDGKVPIETYFGGLLLNGLTVEPARGSNFINISYAAADPKFAAAAANAFSRAYLDVAVEMRVEPAKQYASWFDAQSKVLRSDLEQAQARLSKYQQEKGITDERLEQEQARLNNLIGQLTAAQAERADATSRLGVSGGDGSPDVQQSPSVQAIRSQIATTQNRITEISTVVGSNHPQRLALESQLAEQRQQLAAEIRRVAGSTAATSRASTRKLAELQTMVEEQKTRVLGLRSSRDDIQVLVRDVENAQRAYENARSKLSQLSLESQTNQHDVRVMSSATEPIAPSRKEMIKRLIMSLAAGAVVGLGVAFGLELLDRRVRGPEDMMAVEGVPVLGVLGPPGSKAPVFRHISYGTPPPRLALPPAGAQ
jgi:chain length determinant protein EpsF